MLVDMVVFDASTGETYTVPVEHIETPEEEYVPSVPQSISRFQASVALMDAGLLADVELAIADADVITQLAWERATEWRRDSPTIASIGAALDLDPDQIDDLFRAAAQITA